MAHVDQNRYRITYRARIPHRPGKWMHNARIIYAQSTELAIAKFLKKTGLDATGIVTVWLDVYSSEG